VCHNSFIYKPWLIDRCAIADSCVSHDQLVFVPCLIHRCTMTHSYVCHDLFICVPLPTHVCAMTHPQCHDCSIGVPRLICMCTITHSYVCNYHSCVCQDFFIHMSWLSTHSEIVQATAAEEASSAHQRVETCTRVTWLVLVWCDSFPRVIWLKQVCYDSFMRIPWLSVRSVRPSRRLQLRRCTGASRQDVVE